MSTLIRCASRVGAAAGFSALFTLATAAPALAYGPGVGGDPFVGPGAGPTNVGGSGTGAIIDVSNQTVAPGGSTDLGIAAGPCSSGTSVNLFIVNASLTNDAPSPPVLLGSTTANSQGGFPPDNSPPVTVTLPSDAAPGPYVVFGVCSGPNGPQVVTAGLSVVPNSHAASTRAVLVGLASSADPQWSAPTGWGNPGVRALVSRAVDATVQGLIRSAEAAAPGAAGAPAPAVVGFADTPAVASGSAVSMRYVVPPVLIVGIGAAVLLTPRRLLLRIRRSLPRKGL